MPKRKNSSIKEYYLKSGAKRYMFQIYLGKNSNRKKIITRRRGFKSYAEAEAAFNKLSQVKADEFVKQKQIKLAELWDIWFAKYVSTVKSSTANKTKINYQCHIKPFFGNNYIDSISIKDLQLWADKLATEIVKYRDSIFIMRSLYEYGMRLGYVDEVKINRIIIPKKTSRKRRDTKNNVYSKEELDKFLEIAQSFNLRIFTFFKLLSSTGLRKGEALALTWEDIDLINNTIKINKTLAYGLDNKIIVNSPKTKESNRVIPLSPNLKALLLKYRKNEKIISAKVFHTISGNYLPLSTPANWLNKIYKQDHENNVKFAKENNLDESYVMNADLKHITIHGFRHTFATLLIENTSVKPKTVQMLLGHANIQMTLNIYTHVNNKNKEDAMNSITQLNL